MRAGVEGESARGCLHAGAVGEHAGIFDGDDGIVRGDFADADRGAEGRGEAAWEGDYVAGSGEEEGGIAAGGKDLTQSSLRSDTEGTEKTKRKTGGESKNCLSYKSNRISLRWGFGDGK